MANAFDTATNLYKSWTLDEENKNKLLDLTKSEISKAWWDRQAGILSAQNTLKWLSQGTTTWTPTPTAPKLPTNDFTWASGYTKDQVWIPWVNLTKWVTPKAELWKVEDTTGWVVMAQWNWVDKPNVDSVWFDATKIKEDTTWMTSIDLDTKLKELQSKQKEEWLKAEDYKAIQGQIEYYNSAKTNLTRTEENRNRQQEMNTINGQISDIQSSQRIRNAENQVKSLKQNLWYIGTMWTPWVSQNKLSAVENQIKEADKVFGELVTVEQLQKQAVELWQESQAIQFERQMEDLQNDLNDKVNQSIQDALSWLTQKEISQVIEDPDQMEKIRVTLLNELDKNVANITEANFRKRQYVIDQMTNIVTQTKEKEANKQKINQDMSAIQGYYVDWNGEPIISATTWKRINIPTKSPLAPIYDKEKWQLITFSLDENGKMVGNMEQIVDQPTFAEGIVSWVANMIASWRMNLKDVKDMYPWLEQNPAIIGAFKEAPANIDMIKADLEKKKYELDLRKFEAEKWLIDTATSSWTVPSITLNAQISQDKRDKKNLQCWEFVNDLLSKKVDVKLWDSYQSKIDAISKIWRSDKPQPWSVFVLNTGTDTWHTWIIQSVNTDWSLVVQEANKDWSKQWWEPTLWTYKSTTWMTFSKPVVLDKQEYTDSQKNIMNMIDTKSISKIEEAQLKKAWLSIQDVANYKTTNPKADVDTVLKIKTHFDTLPQVKDWNTTQWVKEWLSTAKWSDLSWPAIQWLISNYAKILDPTSVVRESEYAMAQKWASQWAIDKTKQQIATFIAWWSNVLSKEAQWVLIDAMQRRIDAMWTAYNNIAKQEVKRTNALGIPLTIEQLTWEQEAQPQENTTEAPQSTVWKNWVSYTLKPKKK